jgi:iron(III) transport system substrate-binding protein
MKRKHIVVVAGLSTAILLIPFISLTAKAATAEAQPAALKKVIEAAKAEGEVNYFAAAEWEEGPIMKGIKDKFGVDIKVTRTHGSQTAVLGTAAMEIKAGAPPSFDLMHLAASNILQVAVPQGLMEDIDWQSLMTPDMDKRNYVQRPGNYISTWGYVQVLAYHASKVSAQELPKTAKDFTDPKWRGKFAWSAYPAVNIETTYFLGLKNPDAVQFIRDIVKNKPVLAAFPDIRARLELGEVPLAVIGSHEYNIMKLRSPNIPVQWANVNGLCMVNEHGDALLKGAKHKNAAMLLVLWLASPEGHAYTASRGFSNYLSSKTIEYQMVAEAKKAGVPVVQPARDQNYIKWLATPEANQLLKDLGLALKGN